MEVILLERIENLGQLGDQVKVRPGYARNFLLPQGKATEATQENRERFEARRAELEKQAADTLMVANLRREQLNDLLVTLSVKTGAEGQLYGSVGASDIAEAVSQAGVELKRQEVLLPDGPIRQMGEYDVTLRLHNEVQTIIHVNVVAE